MTAPTDHEKHLGTIASTIINTIADAHWGHDRKRMFEAHGAVMGVLKQYLPRPLERPDPNEPVTADQVRAIIETTMFKETWHYGVINRYLQQQQEAGVSDQS